MKKIYKFLLVFFLTFISSNLFSQFAEPVTRFPFINGPSTDVYPQCASGLIYDDNTWENGYGWNTTVTDGRIVQKFTPTEYPYTINQICFALTRTAAGSANWTFDIIIYDTTGAGGTPGNLITTIAGQTASNVPVWPSTVWFDFTNVSAIPPIANGSYYIGLKWNIYASPSHYLCADESPATPVRSVYAWVNEIPWQPMASYFPNCKAVGIRIEGTPPILEHNFAVGPFLSLPSTFTAGINYTIKAKIRNTGSSNESNVPIKLFVDGTLAGSVNISLNAGTVDSAAFTWIAAGGNHTLKIASALATDLNRNNDTVTANIFVLAAPIYPGFILNGCRNGLYRPTLNGNWVYDSIQVTFPTWTFGIQRVEVKIDTLVHTWDSDLLLILSHGGRNVTIINHVGGGGDNFIGTVLSDSASTPISMGSAPFTGSYKPSNPLNYFGGYIIDPNGFWKLSIFDDGGGDTGYLKAWCLTINSYIYIGGIQTITIPNYFALKQNYPNPFNPYTKIEYYIPQSGNVSLVVYDITGREISVLVNENKNPGIYTVDFNGSNLSSGVYFYKMKTGDYTDTKKMLMVK